VEGLAFEIYQPQVPEKIAYGNPFDFPSLDTKLFHT